MKSTIILLIFFLPLFALGQTASIGDVLNIPFSHYDKVNEIDLSKIIFSLSSIDCSNLDRCIDEIIIVNEKGEIECRKHDVEGLFEFPRLGSSSYLIYLVRGKHISVIQILRDS